MNLASGKMCVVIGGAGFIGSHLCDALVERGIKTVCVDNLVGTAGSTRNIDHLSSYKNFDFVEADLLDWVSEEALKGTSVVFNQAASKNTVSLEKPERDLEVNGLGVLRLLRASNAAGVSRVVHASSGSVFGDLMRRQDEDHPTRPVSFYGVSKLSGESYCRAFSRLYGLTFSVLRYYHVVGPRQDSSPYGGVLPIFVRQATSGPELTIFGSGEQSRSFTSVHDVVRANLAVAESDRAINSFFNCASGIKVSINELARYIQMQTHSPFPVKYLAPRPGDIFDFDVDASALEGLGVTFNRDWHQMVDEVIDSHV